MEENRTIGIVLAELALEKLKAEEFLEQILNVPVPNAMITDMIKKKLLDIVNIEAMINKMQSYITIQPPNEEKQILKD